MLDREGKNKEKNPTNKQIKEIKGYFRSIKDHKEQQQLDKCYSPVAVMIRLGNRLI